jgi:hypothetical protein
MKLALFLLTLAATSFLPAQEILVTFEFSGLKGNEPDVAAIQTLPGIEASPLTRGKGLNDSVEAKNTFAANGWTTSGEATANDYFEFTVRPQTGTVSLTSVEFTTFANPNGPTHFTVRSSVDNFTSDLLPVHEHTPERPVAQHTVALGEPFQSVTDPVTFRLFAWGAKSGGSGVLGIGDPNYPTQLQVMGMPGK